MCLFGDEGGRTCIGLSKESRILIPGMYINISILRFHLMQKCINSTIYAVQIRMDQLRYPHMIAYSGYFYSERYSMNSSHSLVAYPIAQATSGPRIIFIGTKVHQYTVVYAIPTASGPCGRLERRSDGLSRYQLSLYTSL